MPSCRRPRRPGATRGGTTTWHESIQGGRPGDLARAPPSRRAYGCLMLRRLLSRVYWACSRWTLATEPAPTASDHPSRRAAHVELGLRADARHRLAPRHAGALARQGQPVQGLARPAHAPPRRHPRRPRRRIAGRRRRRRAHPRGRGVRARRDARGHPRLRAPTGSRASTASPARRACPSRSATSTAPR